MRTGHAGIHGGVDRQSGVATAAQAFRAVAWVAQRRSQNAERPAPLHCVPTRCRTEFAVDVFGVRPERIERDEQPIGDLFVRGGSLQETQQFQFPGGQWLDENRLA
jgi:hypothetical protein